MSTPSKPLRLVRVTEDAFADFETLTRDEGGGGCFCAFWHQKWTGMDAWKTQCREAPERNRAAVLDRIRGGFHVGVLAYDDQELVAWVSVGPLPEFYWTWKRVAVLGEAAAKTAGIVCLTLAPAHRYQGLQERVLRALGPYGRALGWTAIEGYPFDPSAIAKHGREVHWPGLASGFRDAGFNKVGPHWLNHPEWERSIYRLGLD